MLFSWWGREGRYYRFQIYDIRNFVYIHIYNFNWYKELYTQRNETKFHYEYTNKNIFDDISINIISKVNY